MNAAEIVTTIGAVVAIYMIVSLAIGKFRTKVQINEMQKGLLFRNGKLIGEVQSGKHVFWGLSYEVQTFDVSPRLLSTQTQEVMTSDDVAVKASMIVIYSYENLEQVYRSGAKVEELLYVNLQLSLRDELFKYKHDELIESRSVLNDSVRSIVVENAKKYGLKIDDVAVRDIIFPSEIKAARLESLTAKMKGLARVEEARGEAAAMRTLANATKMFEGKPEAVQMALVKTLEKAASTGCNQFKITIPNFKGDVA